MKLRTMAGLAGLALLAACYHATIETGLPPGSTVIDQQWAMGYVYGLVPPSTVQTMQRCGSGVAKVETEHAFLNMLVQYLTFGIITPMHIKVTCAAGPQRGALPGAALDLGSLATPEAAQWTVAQAALLSAQTRQPVFIRWQ